MKRFKIFCLITIMLVFYSKAIRAENLNFLKNIEFVKHTLVFEFVKVPSYEIWMKNNTLYLFFPASALNDTEIIKAIPKKFFKNWSFSSGNFSLSFKFVLPENFNFKAERFETSLLIEFFNSSQKISSKFIKVYSKNATNRFIFLQPVIPLLKNRKYKGRLISVDFQEADIHSVLRILAQIGGFNLVVSDKVQGKITMKLDKVPWDEVLDLILINNNLGMVKIGNIIRIAPLEELKKQISEYQNFLTSMKKIEETVPVKLKIIKLKYIKGDQILDSVKTLLGKEGTVTYDKGSNTFFIKARPEVLKEIEELIKNEDRPKKQILIEARIVEIQENYLQQLGVKWGGAFWKAGGHTIIGVSPNPSGTVPDYSRISSATGGWEASGDVSVSIPPTSIVDLGVAGSSLGLLLGNIDKSSVLLDMVLSGLEQKGVARIFSSPKILTLDNQPAEITQGDKIPYPKLTSEGTVTTDFVQAGLKLKVIPHVSGDNRIIMEIDIEKSTPDWAHAVNQVPAISTKSAKTTVIVKNGETIVIGGIRANNISKNKEQVPLLAKIPLLGELFKRKERSNSRSELLIFITPKIVNMEIPGVDY